MFHGIEDLGTLVETVARKRVVLLGESTHGTQEFYSIRAEISERLIREHGFRAIAVEGDWPDASRLSDYLRSGMGGSASQVLRGIHRWPTWMWANTAIADLGEALRGTGAAFYGLDVYSLFESLAEAVTLLEKVDPALAKRVQERYECFERFQMNEKAYARSLFARPEGCEEQVIRNLAEILELRLENGSRELLFDARQNARVVRNAEAYYRTMIHGDEDSWNVRDRHMLDTLQEIQDFEGEDARLIVWAHNTHIGDYRATDMVEEGLVNLGGLVRERWGRDQVMLVGMGTHSGTVIAGRAWGATPRAMKVPPGMEGSLEARLHRVSRRERLPDFFFFTRELPEQWNQRIGHRAIGVVYDPEHERGNYVPTHLLDRYDAFIFLDETRALNPLHTSVEPRDFPETYPSGQ